MAIRRSLGFSALTQLINFLLSFGSVIIVSRLLTPEEIGIFSVSVSLLGFAHILRDFGVGNYLIQVKEVTRANMRAAFSVMLYSSWLIAALLFRDFDVDLVTKEVYHDLSLGASRPSKAIIRYRRKQPAGV